MIPVICGACGLRSTVAADKLAMLGARGIAGIKASCPRCGSAEIDLDDKLGFNDPPMDVLKDTPAVVEQVTCANCFQTFPHQATDPADPLPVCPNCGSVATTVAGPDWGKVERNFRDVDQRRRGSAVQAATEVDEAGSGFLGWLIATYHSLSHGGGEIPSWFPKSMLTEHERRTGRWHTNAGANFAYAKIREIAAHVLMDNPGLTAEAALDVAVRTVERFPRLARGNVWADEGKERDDDDRDVVEDKAHAIDNLLHKRWHTPA